MQWAGAILGLICFHLRDCCLLLPDSQCFKIIVSYICLFFFSVSGDKVKSLLFLMLSSKSFVLCICIFNPSGIYFFIERNIVLIFFPVVNQLPKIVFWILPFPPYPVGNVTFIISQTFIDTWVRFWNLYSVPLIFHFIE